MDWQPIETIPTKRPAPVVELKDDHGRITEGFKNDGEPISFLLNNTGAQPPFIQWRSNAE